MNGNRLFGVQCLIHKVGEWGREEGRVEEGEGGWGRVGEGKGGRRREGQHLLNLTHDMQKKKVCEKMQLLEAFESL